MRGFILARSSLALRALCFLVPASLSLTTASLADPSRTGTQAPTLTAPFALRVGGAASSASVKMAALSERREQTDSPAAAEQGATYEALLSPQCKRDLCHHEVIRNVEPFEILKSGTIRRYDASSIERKCPDEGRDQADCRRPASSEYTRFERNFAFCSPATPAIVTVVNDTASSRSYLATFLNFGKEMKTYQVGAVLEYLVVCHGWEPRRLDEAYQRYLVVLGYNVANETPAPSQKRFASEAEALAFLRAQDMRASTPTAPSVQALEGKWYSDDAAVCKGAPGETEGLLTFKSGRFIGLESNCTIRQAKAEGRSLTIRMLCYSEGMQSQESETIEFLAGDRIKRSMSDGRKRYSFTHTRCP